MSLKKLIVRSGLAFVVLVGLLVVAVYVIVHTAAFNRFVITKITQKAEESIGGRMAIGELAIHWSHLGVDFYDVSLSGKNGDLRTPLLTADHLGVGLKIVSLFKHEIDLDEIVLDHPVVRFNVDARGNTNLPQSNSPSTTTQSTSVFDLGVKNVSIREAEIYYNDQRVPLSAELHEFHTKIASGLLSADYKGTLGYERGWLMAQNFSPVEHSAQLSFTVNRSNLVLDSVDLSIGKSHLQANARLTNYANPEIEGSFDGDVFADELARIIQMASIPSGEIAINGTIHYHAAANQSFLALVDLAGSVHSVTLRIPLDRVVVEVKSVNGTYALRDGNLDVHNLNASLLGGTLSANYEMLHLDGTPDSHFDAKVRGVSLGDISDLAYEASHQRVNLLGRADMDLKGSWPKSVQSLKAVSHIVIRSPAQASARKSAIPLDGVIDASYDAANDTASFGTSHLQTGNTNLSLSGTVSKQSNLNVQASTRDLSEIASLISIVRASTAKPGSPPSANLPALHGSASFTGQVSGAVSAPLIKGQLIASNIQVADSRWPELKTQVELNSSLASLQNGYIESGQQGRIEFGLRVGLQDWSFTDSSPISIDATATRVSLADLQQAANVNYPITGVLAAKISLSGSERNPSGHGSLQISDATAWNEPVRTLAADFSGDGKSIHSTAQLQIPAGSVSADVTYSPSQRSYQTTLNVPGLKLEDVQTLQARNLDVSGTLSGSASGSGTLDAPQLAASLQIPTLQIRGQTISQLKAALDVNHQHANVAINSTVSEGYVQAKADVGLTGEYPATASVDVRALPLQLLLAAYVPNNVKFNSQTEFHATLSGPLKEPQKLVAHLEIPQLSVAYGTMKIANTSPLKLDYSDETISLKRAEMKGSGTDFVVQGEVPVSGTAALNLSASGTLDLGILQGLAPDTHSSGQVNLEVSARGALSNPDVQGTVRVENVAFSSASLPGGIEGMNGKIALSGKRVDVQQLAGKMGGGDLSVQGSVVYGGSSIYHLALHASSVRIRPEQMRAVLNADLQLNGTSQDSLISGRVLVDRVSFVQGFDLADFTAQFSGPESVTTPSALETSMKLNINVQSSQDLNLASNQLSLEGAANLNIVGNVGNPVILGRISLTGGEVFFLGKRYQLQSGSVVFANPVRTEPNLNLFVSTTVEQYNITLNLVGPLDRLRTNYTSDPSLPTLDVINLIAFGQTTAEKQSSSANSTATSGAESVVAQGVSGQVASRFAKAAGISQLTIDPLAGGSQNPGAQVAIQQRVTGNLLLTFSTDVTSTQSEAVQLQYQLNPRWQLTLLRDQNGGYAISVRLHKEF